METQYIMAMTQEKEQYRICPNCSNFSHISEEHKYCIICGEKLIDKCPKCDAPITNPTAKFCPKCGERYGKGEE
jgi:hypothetical protein